MENRNPYLITKALKTFLWGSVLAAVSSQIATTIDAIVVSNIIGPAAISAINVDMPVLTLFACLMILFGIGASIIAAKAIGRRDDAEANGVFTTSVLVSAGAGIFMGLLVFLISPALVGVLTGGDEAIYGYALSYLQVMCVSTPFLMMTGTVQSFVRTDGNPKLVMLAVIAGSILNLILDIVFVRFLDMGIAGSAWATGLNYLLSLVVCMGHFRQPHNSLKWRPDRKRALTYIRQSVAQGAPMCINSLLLGGCIFFINYIVLNAAGSDGIYCWAVCLQIFMILQMVLTGVGSSIYALGGILMGERDMKGFSIVNRKCILYSCGTLAVVAAFILATPGAFAYLFGNRPDHPIDFLDVSLRAFSILLIPYAIVALQRSTYQILGRGGLSLFLSVAQILIMVGFVWAFSYISPTVMWWGFPSSAVTLLALLLGYTWIVHRRNPVYRPVTLIPAHPLSNALNISVSMNHQSVSDALSGITAFLHEQDIPDAMAYEIRLSCEELMNNIVDHAVRKNPEKHYFDLHIRCDEKAVNVLLKDDGRPFNPILGKHEETPSANPEDHLGLKIVNNTNSTLNYKYMYSQNVVMLSFPR